LPKILGAAADEIDELPFLVDIGDSFRTLVG
jgi:hypothetical protein